MGSNLKFFCVCQVAHFYNTIDQEMLPSQQSMMLESALAFEDLIKHPSKVAGMAAKSQSKDRDSKVNALSSCRENFSFLLLLLLFWKK